MTPEVISAIFMGVAAILSAPGVAAWFKAREAAVQARVNAEIARLNNEKAVTERDKLAGAVQQVHVMVNDRITQLVKVKDEMLAAQQASIDRLNDTVAALVSGHTADAAKFLASHPEGSKTDPIHVSLDLGDQPGKTEEKP